MADGLPARTHGAFRPAGRHARTLAGVLAAVGVAAVAEACTFPRWETGKVEQLSGGYPPYLINDDACCVPGFKGSLLNGQKGYQTTFNGPRGLALAKDEQWRRRTTRSRTRRCAGARRRWCWAR